MIRIKLLVLLVFIASCTSKNNKENAVQIKADNKRYTHKTEIINGKISCSDLKVNEYYYNDAETFKNGSVKLFSYKKGERFDALNKLIFKNSEYLLNIYSENGDLSFHRETDTVLDYSQDNKKFQDWVDHLDLSKKFTLDSESESYQKRYKEMSRESVESLSTEMFCLDKILVYKIQYSYSGDKGSPYYEYLNIDLNKLNLIDFSKLISMNRLDSFNKTILLYVENHKKETVSNYKEGLSEKADQLLVTYQDVFEKSNYNYKKIKCKINSNNFYHFSPNGIVFNVNVKDENFLLDKENPRIEEYVSEITIPYKEVIHYLDIKNSLYSSISKQAK